MERADSLPIVEPPCKKTPMPDVVALALIRIAPLLAVSEPLNQPTPDCPLVTTQPEVPRASIVMSPVVAVMGLKNWNVELALELTALIVTAVPDIVAELPTEIPVLATANVVQFAKLALMYPVAGVQAGVDAAQP